MTNKFITFAAVAAITLAACDKNDEKENKYEDTAFTGTMVVTYEGDAYTTEGITVLVSGYDGPSDNHIDITMKGVKFVPQMPVTIDVIIPDVTASNSNGTISISGDDITPTLANGTPYPAYMVKNLKGAILGYGESDANIDMSLYFGDYPTTYTGKNQQQ